VLIESTLEEIHVMNCDTYKDQIIFSQVFQRNLDKKLHNNQLWCKAYHL